MNALSALVPVASAALAATSEQLSDAIGSSLSFAELLAQKISVGVAGARSPDAAATTRSDSELSLTSEGEQVQLDALRQQLEMLRETLQRELQQRFTAAGIDLSEPAVLVADGQGRVLEQGGHWDRAKIEQVLAEDQRLSSQVRQLLSQAASLQSLADSAPQVSGSPGSRLVVGDRGAWLQTI